MPEPDLDLVGIGFGPSNLAMAIAIEEHNRDSSQARVNARFLERQVEFGWHRGMLLEDATMQVSFLKDLVTLRNPSSDFSFLRYLHSKDRLVDFINHKTLFPLRVEFHDYFSWAAAQVADQVRYDNKVISVTPVGDENGEIHAVDVISQCSGAVVTHRARNLVIGTGLRPRMPAGVQRSAKVWHSSDLLRNVGSVQGTQPHRVVVVGAGQSAAEAVAFLHAEFPSAEVCAVISRYGYSPADDSSFANGIFDPDAVDEFFDAPTEVKQSMMDYHGNTNYSVVDIDLIQELYRRSYREKVLGRERLRILNLARTTSVSEKSNTVEVTVESLVNGERSVLDADVVVFATGYDEADPYAVLGELSEFCRRDEQGRPQVGRDYRIATDSRLRAGVYLQGGTEHSHGISSALLSNTAIRVGEVLDSVLQHRAAALLVAV